MITKDILTNGAIKTKSLWLRLQKPFELFVFPAILILWPFVNIFQGVDLADTTYSLTNYTYMEGLDPMWLLATWLPNMLGYFFSRLPGGGSLPGMNVYCTAIIAATGLISYFGLGGLMIGMGIDREKLSGKETDNEARLFQSWARFVGVFTAESLCWCPSVILYNYLTYFFMTLALIFLLHAFSGSHKGRRERLYYWLAGVCLGVNVFVRFPNVVEVLFIIAVIFFGVMRSRSETATADNRTGVHGDGRVLRANLFKRVMMLVLPCVTGYITGVIAILLLVIAQYGSGAYFSMIESLFSMTGQASDYTAAGMLTAVLAAYLTTLREFFLAVPVIVTGAAIFYFAERAPRLKWAGRLVFSSLLVVLIYWYYRTGVFTRNYQYYDSMFEPAMMLIIGAIVLFVVCMTGGFWNADTASNRGYAGIFFRPAALLCLLVILITPLGSNNYTFPVVNNLFIVLPVAFTLLAKAFRRTRAEKDGARLLWQSEMHLIWQLPAVGLVLLLVVQASLFHVNFAFGDGTDGTPRDSVVYGVPAAHRMKTTAENAEGLEELYTKLHVDFKEETADAGGKAIIFGNAPGLHYLMRLEPALFTAWPDLDSNSIDRVVGALDELTLSGEDPLVLVRDTGDFSGSADEKMALLLDYIDKNGYNKLFEVNFGDLGGVVSVYAKG